MSDGASDSASDPTRSECTSGACRQPKLSVLCPVFNGSSTLEASVESVRSQTLTDWELLLLDDGSEDESLEVCRTLAARDPRIRVLCNARNRGLGSAMSRLAAAARAPYVAVQEQDDVSLPDRFRREVEVLDQNAEIGLVSGIAEWLDSEDRAFARFPGLLERGEQYPQDTMNMVRFLFVEQCKVVNAGCMFRREVLARPDVFFDEEAKMSVDWQFFIRVAHHYLVWGLPRVVVRMRRTGDSLTGRKALQFQEARRCLRILLRDYEVDSESVVDRALYRQALAAQMVLEGRTLGGWIGLSRLVQAWTLDPLKSETRNSVRELLGRGLRRAGRFGRAS